MKVSFFVLLACLCFAAVLATPGGKKESKKESQKDINKDGLPVEKEKVITVYESEAEERGDEEVIKVRTSVQGKRKGKRKKEQIETIESQVPCSQLLVKEMEECNAPNQKCSFNIQNEENCAYECKCEAERVEISEYAIEEERENGEANLIKEKRKVKKDGGKKKKVKKQAGGKECAGEKVFSFSNCLIKMKGLVTWGENSNRFEEIYSTIAEPE